MTNEMGDLHQKMSFLYYKIETAEGKVRILERRFFACLKLLQVITEDYFNSEALVKKAMDSLELNILILTKTSPEMSPDRDHWILKGLSHTTGEKYFSDWGIVRDYDENDLILFSTFDEEVTRKLIEKMVKRDDYSWEFIGHVEDLVSD